MEITEVETLVKRLMRKYNISGWSITWEDIPGFRGCCDYNIKTISLNPNLLKTSYFHIVNTILHELGHALTPNEAKAHGPLWEKTFLKLISDFCYV